MTASVIPRDMLHLRHQETPSRILRRIQEAENDSDMPSLPSMASMDGSEEEDDDHVQSRVESKRTPRVDASTTASFSSAGRPVSSHSKSRRQQQQHQNNKAISSNNRDNGGRNILSPLRLNGRQSPATETNVNAKGKGKAFSQDSPAAPSPGPLSAVSSNRTVRPASHSPHDFRATSITPSMHVTSRHAKASQRMQSITFDDSLPSAVVDHSDQHEQQHHEEQTEEDRNVGSFFVDISASYHS